MSYSDEVWVIDSSSIIKVKEIVPESDRTAVFAELTAMVDSGSLYFPEQVVEELDITKNKKKPDDAYLWAKRNKPKATVPGPAYAEVKVLLSDPIVARVIDSTKTSEEADPYVLAYAEIIKPKANVVVLTEDQVTRPNKMSLADACGLRRIVTLSMEPFLRQNGIWSS